MPSFRFESSSIAAAIEDDVLIDIAPAKIAMSQDMSQVVAKLTEAGMILEDSEAMASFLRSGRMRLPTATRRWPVATLLPVPYSVFNCTKTCRDEKLGQPSSQEGQGFDQEVEKDKSGEGQ